MISLICGIKKNWTHRKQNTDWYSKRQAVGSDKNGWGSQKIPQKVIRISLGCQCPECWLYYIAYLKLAKEVNLKSSRKKKVHRCATMWGNGCSIYCSDYLAMYRYIKLCHIP